MTVPGPVWCDLVPFCKRIETCARAGLNDGDEQRLEDWRDMLAPAYRTSPARQTSADKHQLMFVC